MKVYKTFLQSSSALVFVIYHMEYIFQSNAFGAALFNGNLVVSITSDEKVSNIDSAEKYDDDKWHYLTVTKVDKQ